MNLFLVTLATIIGVAIGIVIDGLIIVTFEIVLEKCLSKMLNKTDKTVTEVDDDFEDTDEEA